MISLMVISIIISTFTLSYILINLKFNGYEKEINFIFIIFLVILIILFIINAIKVFINIKRGEKND